MSLALRIVLLVSTVLVFIIMLRSVKRAKMRIEDTLFWAGLMVLILILAIFPQIASALSDLMGFMAPVNAVFLFFIFVLLMKAYSLSRTTSELETKVKELTQQIAIDRLMHYERENPGAFATHSSDSDDSQK